MPLPFVRQQHALKTPRHDDIEHYGARHVDNNRCEHEQRGDERCHKPGAAGQDDPVQTPPGPGGREREQRERCAECRPSRQGSDPKGGIEQRRPHAGRNLRVVQVVVFSELERVLPQSFREVVPHEETVHEVGGFVGVVVPFPVISARGDLAGDHCCEQNEQDDKVLHECRSCAQRRAYDLQRRLGIEEIRGGLCSDQDVGGKVLSTIGR